MAQDSMTARLATLHLTIDHPKTGVRMFRYALVNRPAGIGCVPRDLRFEVEPRPAKGAPHYEMARHGIMVAERALTNFELANFELAPLLDGVALEAVAQRIAGSSMSNYASAYLEAKEDDPQMFRGRVFQELERLDRGVRYSVGDEDELIRLVAEGLSRYVVAETIASNEAGKAAPRSG